MSEFQREDRYIVIKRSDLERLRGGQTEGLRQQLSKVYPLLPKRQCAVIESDWPEFEQVWRMIEARVAGNPLPDYDALAAQRDEGLAREELMRLGYEQCKQRLAEAEKLLRKVDMRPAGTTADVPVNWWNRRVEFLQSCLASPGCADGVSAECAHSYANKLGCPECGEDFGK